MKERPGNIAVALMMAVGVSLLAGCATYPPPKAAIADSRDYGDTYDDVWDSVLSVLSELNIQIRSMDREAGTIVAEDSSIELRQFELGRYDSKYCFCGTPERYHFFRGLTGEYTIAVTRGNMAQTIVNIDASFRASVQSGDRSTGWHPCPTKGVFEPFFLEQVGIQLANSKKVIIPVKKKEPPQKLDWWKPERGY